MSEFIVSILGTHRVMICLERILLRAGSWFAVGKTDEALIILREEAQKISAANQSANRSFGPQGTVITNV